MFGKGRRQILHGKRRFDLWVPVRHRLLKQSFS